MRTTKCLTLEIGIGLMITKALARNGAAKLYIAARRIEPLKTAASSIGEHVIPIQCDVTDKEDLKRAVKTVKDDAGYLNLLVCNSGTTGPGIDMAGKQDSLEEFSARHMGFAMDDYIHPFMVNVVGVWYTAMAFLPLLDAGNKAGNVSQTSQVIVMASIAGLVKAGGAGWAYGQSKAASIHASKQLATLLPRWNMRANCIAPGCKSIFCSKQAKSSVLIMSSLSKRPSIPWDGEVEAAGWHV